MTWGGASTSRGRAQRRPGTRPCSALLGSACSSRLWCAARRYRATTALLVALAVSLVVNDSPVDELVWGAIGAAALLAWETPLVRAAPGRPSRKRRQHPPSLQREAHGHRAGPGRVQRGHSLLVALETAP